MLVMLFFLSCLSAGAQQTRGIEPMLGQCWAAVPDGDPTLTQHWLNGSCLLGGLCEERHLQDLHVAVHDVPSCR